MLESISSLLASLKAATPPVLIGIALFCAALLFSPIVFTAKLGLGAFIENYRAYLGGGFAASACILLAQFLWWLKDHLLATINALRRSRNRKHLVSELTPDEKAYLVRYIEERQNTQYFRIDDGISRGLEAKGIIFQASNVGYMLDGWAYNLQPWARRYLSKHPEALAGANEPPEALPGGAPSFYR